MDAEYLPNSTNGVLPIKSVICLYIFAIFVFFEVKEVKTNAFFSYIKESGKLSLNNNTIVLTP